MKRLSKRAQRIALIALAIAGMVPVVMITPVMAGLKQVRQAVTQTLDRPQVKLALTVEQQVVEQNQQGKQTVLWKAMEGKVAVKPGNVLRYSVKGQNVGNAAAKNLIITQPIPRQTVYIVGSTSNSNNAKATYSINNGKSFVENPTVQVKLPDGTVKTRSAPAEAYTHVRWTVSKALSPKAGVSAEYQVKVR